MDQDFGACDDSAFAFTAARADDASIWKARQARFSAYATKPDHPDAEIAKIKARTAALIAKAAPFDPPQTISRR